ncbi:hypothetical protein [Nocardia sp. CA-290969]
MSKTRDRLELDHGGDLGIVNDGFAAAPMLGGRRSQGGESVIQSGAVR